MEISFSAESLTSADDIKVVRPTFADGGNTRFASFLAGVGPEDNNSHNWGTTVHLGKLAENSAEVSGLPERVSSAVAVVGGAFRPSYLGTVVNTRGVTVGVDDDAAFAERLLGATTEVDIVEGLVKAVTGS